MANNKRVYEEKIRMLVQAIWQISLDEGIPFSFTCTADVKEGGMVVAKSANGNLDPTLVDPYTRISLLLCKFEPDEAEEVFFQLLTFLVQRQWGKGGDHDPHDEKDPTNRKETPISVDFSSWLDDELKGLGL